MTLSWWKRRWVSAWKRILDTSSSFFPVYDNDRAYRQISSERCSLSFNLFSNFIWFEAIAIRFGFSFQFYLKWFWCWSFKVCRCKIHFVAFGSLLFLLTFIIRCFQKLFALEALSKQLRVLRFPKNSLINCNFLKLLLRRIFQSNGVFCRRFLKKKSYINPLLF